MDNWDRVKDIVTPNNLIKCGDPSYSTLAACLGIFEAYDNGPAKKEDDTAKVCIKFSKVNQLMNF